MTKIIWLSAGIEALVDDGDFEELSKYTWCPSADINTYAVRYYTDVQGVRRGIAMHRHILKAPKGKRVRHLNGNTLDNRKSNITLDLIPHKSRRKIKTISHIRERFWKKVDKIENWLCWNWKACKNPKTHYGMFQAFGERYAHRVSYILNISPIPKGIWVLHKCDNPACVNPGHLFLGTAADNARDRQAKGRGRQPKIK